MTTIPDTANILSRDSLSASPDSKRLDLGAYVNPRNRDSYGSSETAESSAAASQRHSLVNNNHGGDGSNSISKYQSGIDGRGSHRSHRSRTSGGFLLTSTTFDPPVPIREITIQKPTTTHISNDHKGKVVVRGLEKKHRKRRSDIGTGLQGSPLAEHVITLPVERQESSSAPKSESGNGEQQKAQPSNGLLDVDSAQIVNLALNLSESRKNVSRRLVSNPLPSPVGGFSETLAGGSMRYHMQQQQRRSSRNISPKPDRGERHFSTSSRIPSGQRLSVPLLAGYDEMPAQYHFSASTIARAEKAKEALELMAQYRELLQYLPPLKPQKLDRATTTSTLGSGNDSPIISQSYKRTPTAPGQKALGRQYNPLQYIRNRKVRARTSKSIDGQAQGFGDLDKVLPWVQEVSREASLPDYQEADCLVLPTIQNDAAEENSQTSPQSTPSRNPIPARARRPRIDWIIDPADMLADVFWLEQADNKKLIEDHYGRRIFSAQSELKRPISRQDPIQERELLKNHPAMLNQDNEKYLDNKLPEFKSVKQDGENFAEKGASRAREKFRHARDAARQHTHHGSSRDVRHLLGSQSKSHSSSSESDSDREPRRKRSGTADTDRGKLILEKQLSRMLEIDKQAMEGTNDVEHLRRRDALVVDSRGSSFRNSHRDPPPKVSPVHSRSGSVVNQSKRDSVVYTSSARASLEVPRTHNRGSLDLAYDSTAPSSPDLRANQGRNSYIPSISMDLSPPQSRRTSPSRSALSKIKAKIRPHHGRNQRSDHSVLEVPHVLNEEVLAEQQDETQQVRRRSISPIKGLAIRDSGEMRNNDLGGGPGYKERSDDPSGIRGFLKSARHPVNRVSEIIWKKDSSQGSGSVTGEVSDDSDVEIHRNNHHIRASTDELAGTTRFDALAQAYPPKEKPSYLENMPIFASSSEFRGRSSQVRDQQRDSGPLLEIKEGRVRKAITAQQSQFNDASQPRLKPEFHLPEWNRQGSISSNGRRESYINGLSGTDARLNAVLGYPGKQRTGVSVTGLASVDATNRRPSLQNKRQWSLTDQAVNVSHDQTTRREIARVRALLLSSGTKAKEISNRATSLTDFRSDKPLYAELAALTSRELEPVACSQQHIVAGQLLSEDVQLSAKVWQESADLFCNSTIPLLHNSIETLQSRLTNTLTPLTRQAADQADEVSKDLVTSQTLNVKRIGDKIERMIRTRKRRFRWLRRGGWVLVEWTLVGVMWYVWFLVVLCRIVLGIGKGFVGSVRWLMFL